MASGRRRPCDAVVVDLDIPGPEGLACLPGLGAMRGQPEVLGVTAERAGATAEDAIRAGAWDVLLHPFDETAMRQALDRCLQHHAARMAQNGQAAIKRDGIIGASLPLERCLHSLGVAARTDTNLLLVGETGTGKELFARAVHANSERAGRAFIVVDCTNLPGTLAESILFGHERGSFTGADTARDGLFKQADGGTIFLDEIGDLDLSVQKSLLRVLQERTFRPISARNEVRSDFRLVAATNCDIEEMVRRGTFRKDLYHRLKTRVIHLPPLRERRDDIKPLVRHYVERICLQLQLGAKQMSSDFLDALRIYHWPGNVRDLINALHYAVQAAFAEQTLYPQHLPVEIRGHALRARCDPVPAYGHEEAAPVADGGGAEPPPVSARADAGWREPQGEQGAHARPEASGGTPPDADRKAPDAAAPAAAGGARGMPPGQRAASAATVVPLSGVRPSPRERSGFGFASETFPLFRRAREMTLDRMEFAYLMELIRRSRGEIAMATELSGLSRARLYELLQKHAISLRGGN